MRWDIAAGSWAEILFRFSISLHEMCLMNIDSLHWINLPEGGDISQEGQGIFGIIKGLSRDDKVTYGGGQTAFIHICE